jgi:hypothetical protein
VVKDAEVAPETGLVMTPEAPAYHWKVGGGVPEAATVRVVVAPLLMVMEAGFVVIAGTVPVDVPPVTLMVKFAVKNFPV